MKSFLEIIRSALELEARDVFLLAGQPVMIKKSGKYLTLEDSRPLSPPDTESLLSQAYELARRPFLLQEGAVGDDRFAISVSGLTRLRISAYRQRSSCAAAVRIIPFGIPDPGSIGIPDDVMALSGLKDGLVLICGPAESGKSTTAACLINRINHTRSCHILTVDSPIEYLYKNSAAFVSQREIPLDSPGICECLRSSRWYAPEVIAVSEVDSGSTARELISLAAGRRLVFATLTANSATEAVSALKELFPENEKSELGARLAGVMRAVVCQRLLHFDGGVKPVFELTSGSFF